MNLPRPARLITALALITAGTLALELLFIRLLSVLTWYALGYLVLSIGLLAFCAGAVYVQLRPEDYAPSRFRDTLAREAWRFAASVPLSLAVLLVVPVRPASDLSAVAGWVSLAAAVGLPFFPAGAFVTAVLTRVDRPIGRLYAADLAGAAGGVLLVPWMLSTLGGPASVLSASIAGAGAGWLIGAGPRVRTRTLGTAFLACLVVLTAWTPFGFGILWVKGEAEEPSALVSDRWNSFSRVVVHPARVEPAILWGAGAKCERPPVRQSRVTIDGEALTVLFHDPPELEHYEFLLCDVVNVAHYLRPRGPLAVVGVGGGRDLLTGLLFEHDPVVGIEVNELLLDLHHTDLGRPLGLASNPRVHLVRDEARSYLAREGGAFQLIQATLTDTWAATGAGAQVFTENGLYTQEAWRTFWNALAPEGILSVSRWWDSRHGGESARLVSLGMATLLDAGVASPRDHLALVTGASVGTLLLSRRPFRPEELERLRFVADSLGFRVALSPVGPPALDILRALVEAPNLEALRRAAVTPVFDFTPPTDRRPFFFQMVRAGATPPDVAATGVWIEGNLLATRALRMTWVLALALVAALVLWTARRVKEPASGSAGLAAVGSIYFLLIGFAFLAAEVGFLLRLSTIAGRPESSLLVLLPALLAGTALGSGLSDALSLDRASWVLGFPILPAAAVILSETLFDAGAQALVRETPAVKLGLAAAVLVGCGLCMGLAFPLGLRFCRRAGLGGLGPWFWGLNGAGSVLGGPAAMAMATAWGIPAVLFAAAAAYAILLALLPVLRKHAVIGERPGAGLSPDVAAR